jgi:hypothetical protein
MNEESLFAALDKSTASPHSSKADMRARCSRFSIPGLPGRSLRWLRPEPTAGVPRALTIRALGFFNMTRSSIRYDVV